MQIRINVKGASRRKAAVVQQVREYPDRQMSVEEFLAETVRQNVKEYNDRKDAGEVLRLFSMERLVEMAESGKVSYGSVMDERRAKESDAVKTALQCFEDGMVALFADGARYSEPGQTIPLREGSEVTFVRLTFLAGRMW